MRGWRHDYRNHIQTMKVLAEKGNLEAIKEYLNKLDEDLATVDTVVKTGNAMADAIYSICNNDSLYEYLKVEGRKEVDSITWEDVALRLRKMYEKVLGW